MNSVTGRHACKAVPWTAGVTVKIGPGVASSETGILRYQRDGLAGARCGPVWVVLNGARNTRQGGSTNKLVEYNK